MAWSHGRQGLPDNGQPNEPETGLKHGLGVGVWHGISAKGPRCMEPPWAQVLWRRGEDLRGSGWLCIYHCGQLCIPIRDEMMITISRPIDEIAGGVGIFPLAWYPTIPCKYSLLPVPSPCTTVWLRCCRAAAQPCRLAATGMGAASGHA